MRPGSHAATEPAPPLRSGLREPLSHAEAGTNLGSKSGDGADIHTWRADGGALDIESGGNAGDGEALDLLHALALHLERLLAVRDGGALSLDVRTVPASIP